MCKKPKYLVLGLPKRLTWCALEEEELDGDLL